jgi:hypothetical protein
MQTPCDSACPLLPTGSRLCHCVACHLTFGGVSGFDAHRQGPATGRNCRGSADLIAMGLTADERQIWRQAARFAKVA